MERVKKGEKYWYIHLGDFNPCALWDWEDDSMYANGRYDNHNYFHTEEEAESMAEKISKVLKGADVIEMPREEEIKQAAYDCTNGYDDDQIPGFKEGVEWLKSKIVK